ncbi:low molecular weight protein-tyrosine-phosphatase [Amorphus sp. 3PC139-8]|uniref:low molecular weight protein-tyrosine-phosphatase n=1 Tax=Amorphus sp. 3PC139-8 TaxID=2735676 RepID=UPI00345C718E
MSRPPETSILFVCLGNICRSPMAAGILRSLAATSVRPIRIESAGVGPWHVGKPPDGRAIAAAQRHGIDLTGERAQMIAEVDYRSYDMILAMDRSVLANVLQRAPADATARIGLFRQVAEDVDADVDDPYTGPEDDFETCFVEIEAAAKTLYARLLEPTPEGSDG